MAYLVAIKHSARRTNAVAGAWVNDVGLRRSFDSKQAARAWAREASEESGRVYVRDANPDDRSPVDGYLMGQIRPAKQPGETPGEQSDLTAVTGES